MIERTRVARIIAGRLAANRAALGRRYGEWVATGRPDVSLQVAALAAEEVTQARALATLAGLSQPEEGGAAVAFLDAPLDSWLDVVAVRLLFDGAVRVVLVAALASTEAPLAAVARDCVRGEYQRVGRTDGWARHISGEGGATARRLDAALARVWDETLCWLGPQGDPLADAWYTLGVLDAMPDVLRARLLSYIGPIARGARLWLPTRPAPHGNAWELTAPLPWHRWNAGRWRLDAH